MEKNSCCRSVADLLEWGRWTLDTAGIPGGNVDARVLLAHVTGVEALRLRFVERMPDPHELHAYGALIEARAQTRLPVQYLTGTAEFMGLDFLVGPGVLIPRPETEHLVEAAASCISRLESPRAADIGTGSGIIAVSLAALHSQLRVWATDISTRALEYALVNADRHGVSDRVQFVWGDLLEPLSMMSRESLDLITCNPPYVRSGDISGLEPEVRAHEPTAALDGGEDGLDLYRRVLTEARELCRSGAVIAFELGAGQAGDVVQMAAGKGYGVICLIRDYAGHERILLLKV